MRKTTGSNVLQGFTPSRIETATTFDTTGVLAVRVGIDSEYYINTDSANKATMLGGSVTVIHYDVTQLVFTVSTVLEVMTTDTAL